MDEGLLDPISPGEILAEEFMRPLDLDVASLAGALRVDRDGLAGVVAGDRRIDADLALRLSRYFGTTPDLWLGLQAEFDLRVTRRSVGAQIERDVRPRAA